MKKTFVSKLVEELGSQKVLYSEPDLICYSYDATPLTSFKPDAIVRAFNEEDILKVLQLAAQEDIPVTTRGSGTGLSGGSVPVKGGIVLVTTAMNKIIEIDADENPLAFQVQITNGWIRHSYLFIGVKPNSL